MAQRLTLRTNSINVSRNLAPFVGSQIRTYGNHGHAQHLSMSKLELILLVL